MWAPSAPTITSPGNYSWTRSSTLVIAGTAEAGSTVEVFDDGRTLGTTVATGSGTWSRTLVGVTDGSHLFTARASNLGGTSPASSTRVVSVDTTPPAVPGFTAPAAGSSQPASFTITGTGESGTTVELFEDGGSRGTVAVSDGTWSRAHVRRGHGHTLLYGPRDRHRRKRVRAVRTAHDHRHGRRRG